MLSYLRSALSELISKIFPFALACTNLGYAFGIILLKNKLRDFNVN